MAEGGLVERDRRVGLRASAEQQNGRLCTGFQAGAACMHSLTCIRSASV